MDLHSSNWFIYFQDMTFAFYYETIVFYVVECEDST